MLKKIRKDLAGILLLNFIASLGFSVVIPFLVVLVTRFGGNAIIYGLIGAIYPFFQLIGAPILGRWSDRKGRRPILVLSHLGTLISWGVFLVTLLIPITVIYDFSTGILGSFMLTVPLLLLFFARSLDGLTGGNITVAQAYLADISSEKDRTKNYGYFSVASSLGFVLGPALAGVLSSTVYGEIIPVIATMLISLVALGVIWFYMPESNAAEQREEEEQNSWLDLLKDRKVRFVMILFFLMFLGFNIFYTAFPVHATTTLGWSVGKLGIYFSVLSLMMVVVQGPVLAVVSKRFSEQVLVTVGTVFLGVNFVFMTQTSELWLYVAIAFFALGNGLMWPSLLSILSKIAPPDLQGVVQGLSGSAGSLAAIVGLIGGGFLYDKMLGFSFLVPAGIFLFVFLASFYLYKLPSQMIETEV